MARRRARWKKYQSLLDPERLVFIDETWAKTNMTRTHGRCAQGQRLVAKVPHAHWRTLTFLAALRYDRIDAPCVIDGPINGLSFLAYVEQVLVPTLSPGDIVIMDNLSSHKGANIRKAIEAGAQSFAICRPIPQTSIRSRWPSPNSRLACANTPSAHAKTYGYASAPCSASSPAPNAKTSFVMQDMRNLNREPL